MSIRIQCCGIVILLILTFFQGRQKKTCLISEQIFRLVVRTALLCLALDVASILVINYAFNTPGKHLPTILVDLVCKAYLLTLPLLGMVTLLYVCSDLYAQWERHRQRICLYGGCLLCGWVGILAAPIAYARGADGQVQNTDGPSVYVTYCLITLVFALLIFHLVRDRARLNQHRRRAVFTWLALWIGSFIIQLLNNSLLLAGFACAAGVLIIYLSLENPEANLDKQTGLLTRGVLLPYLDQLYSRNREFSALLLLFRRSPEPSLSGDDAEEARLELCRYLDGHSDWMVFHETAYKLLLIFDTPAQALRAREQIARHFQQRQQGAERVPLSLRWLVVPRAGDAGSREELLFLLDYASRKYLASEELVTLDAALAQKIGQDRRIERLLVSAMDQDRVEVFYQPIYSTSRRSITCAEALVRIRDEKGDLVPPGAFIPIAESNGMILRLGRMIFEKVCRFIREHPLQSLGLEYIEVNLSMVQCAHADLAVEYIDVMRRFGIDPQYINLEITESASTDAKKTLEKNMGKLIDYGVSFSLDDFGTGQSNLNYIMDIPVEIVKFDRYMTQAYFVSHRAQKVMTAAIHMIHDMGLKIVTEGIETAEQLQTAVGLGVEYIQGYYFSKPLPADEFLAYLPAFQPPAA